MMEDYKARWLVQDWESASDEAKADPRQWGPWAREACREAYRALNLPVPPELGLVSA